MHICRKKTPQSDAGRRSRCFEDAPLSQWSSILQCDTGEAHPSTPRRSLGGFSGFLRGWCSRLSKHRLTPYHTKRHPSFALPDSPESIPVSGSIPMSNLSLAAELRPSRDTFVRTTRLQIAGTWLRSAPLWIPSTHFSISGRTLEAMKSSITCSDPRHACSMHTIFHTFPH